MSKVVKAHIALFLVALIYGANYSIAKLVLDDNYIQPFGFIVFRALSGMGLFWFFHLAFVREKVKKEDIPLLLLCALFGVAVNQMSFFMGLKFTTPINASLIMTTTPILVLIISAILIKEKITFQKMVGIAIGAIGAIILISKGGSFSLQQDQLLGDALVFTNAMSYGIYLVLVKKLMARYHPITVVKWVFTFGLFMVLPFGWNDVKVIEWSTFTSTIWFAFAYVLIAVTFLTYLFNAFALKIVNPSVTSIYIYLQPLFASIIALTMGKDDLGGTKILAGVLIFVGVFLVSKPLLFFQNK